MKINEILIESQLQEGPMLDKFGKAVGGVASGVAKGVGAVAGGIAGMGSAFKKGFSAGKTTVAGDDEAPKKPSMIGDLAKGLGKDAYKGATGYDLPGQDKASLKKKAAAPAASGTAAPAQQPAAAPGTAAPAAKAAPTAKPAAGATPAAAPTAKAGAAAPAAAPNPKADTAYAQAQKAVASLAPKEKSQLIKMLQSDPKVAAAAKAPAKAPAGKMANAPVSKTNTAKPGNPNAAAAPEAPAAADPQAGANAFGQMANTLSKSGEKPAAPATTTSGKPLRTPMALQKPAAEPAADEPNYDTQTGIASPAQMKKNREIAKAEAPYGFDIKTGKPNTAPAASAPDELGRVEPTMEPTKPAAGKEKTIANPVATVGTKRATNIGEPTFDTQTGKALPGQAINAIRKKAEYGTGPLGAARKRIKAGAAAPAESRRTTRPALAEGFSLFRKT
jgi:hypothetical protein